ncbi:MAG: hypothetical protein P8X68_10460 [Desulfobacterales bacterium]
MIQLLEPRELSVRQMLAGILMIGLLAGCAANQQARGNYGRLKLSSEVDQIFQKYQVLPKYRYYFSGSVTKPQAIIGIDRNYTLVTRLWKEVADLTSEQLKKWVDQMLGFRPATRTFGAQILGPNGEPVGIWYSPYNDTTVAVQADNRIKVVPPSYARRPSIPKGLRGFGFE